MEFIISLFTFILHWHFSQCEAVLAQVRGRATDIRKGKAGIEDRDMHVDSDMGTVTEGAECEGKERRVQEHRKALEERSDLEKKKKKFREEVQEIEKVNNILMEEKRELEGEKHKLLNDLAQLKKEKSKIREELRELLGEKNMLQEDRKELERENKKLREELEEFGEPGVDEKRKLREEKVELEEEKTKLREEKEEIEEEKIKLRKEKEEIEEEKARLREEKKRLEEERTVGQTNTELGEAQAGGVNSKVYLVKKMNKEDAERMQVSYEICYNSWKYQYFNTHIQVYMFLSYNSSFTLDDRNRAGL